MSADSFVIPLYEGLAPGSEDWTHEEQVGFAPPPYSVPIVRNVSRPSVEVFLPEQDRATGTAVIVCPGGAFHFLSMGMEGVDVATWLRARGIAAVILKYRLVPTHSDERLFIQQVDENLSDRARLCGLRDRYAPLAAADGRRALMVVREHAAEWGLVPDRIGMLGFSAGGYVTASVAVDPGAGGPLGFAAPIYTSLWESTPAPEAPPPMFIALASNDDWGIDPSLFLYSAWHDRGGSAEMHIYAQGGHGFGMTKQGLPSDGWIDRFVEWLAAQGLTA